MKIVIPGNPIAKMRAKNTMRGGYLHKYDPQKKEQDTTRILIKDQANFSYHKKRYYFDQDKPLMVKTTFYTPTPKSDNSGQKNAKLWGLEFCENFKKDIDNFCKFYLDCMNQLIYCDDSQIVEIHAKRIFDKNPRTEIEVTEIPTPKLTPEEKKFFTEFSPAELKSFFEESAFMFEDYINHDSGFMPQLASNMIKFAKKYSKKLSKLSKLSHDENKQQSADS